MIKQIIFALIGVFCFGLSAFAQNGQFGCATIEMSGGGVVNSGEPMSFSVKVSGSTKTILLAYDWKVSNGTIASGQGTPSITVDTRGVSGSTNITAEVKIKGVPDNCANTASEIGSILPIGCGRPYDEFGKINKYDLAARLQNLYVALNEDYTLRGYIINYGTEKEVAEREKQIQQSLKFLEFDATRLLIVRGGENPAGETGAWSRIWILLPGAELPTP